MDSRSMLSFWTSRNLADSLDTVHSEENPAFFGDFADFSDRIDHPDLVVRVHDGDQDGGRLDGCLQFIQTHAPVALNGQVSDLETFFFQALAGIEDGFVLDCLSDDVIALFAVHLRD